MKHLAALVVLALLVAPSAQAQSKFVPPSTLTEASVSTLMAMQLSAWVMACGAKKLDCNMFAMPHVGYSLLPQRLGQYRPGELTVTVELRLLAQPASLVVMMHEMIHYLQYVTGQTRADSKNYLSPCAREQEAYDLVMKTNVARKLAKGDARILTWERAAKMYYGCALAGRQADRVR